MVLNYEKKYLLLKKLNEDFLTNRINKDSFVENLYQLENELIENVNQKLEILKKEKKEFLIKKKQKLNSKKENVPKIRTFKERSDSAKRSWALRKMRAK